jgi:hypothetical protein
MLMANALAGDVARHLAQLPRQGRPLLAGHLAIAFDLFVQCRCRSHGFAINQFADAYNFKSREQPHLASDVSRRARTREEFRRRA